MDDDYYLDAYFRGTGSSGRKLTPGGPPKPDTTSMGEVEADKVLKVWRKERLHCRKGGDYLMMAYMMSHNILESLWTRSDS